MATYILNPVDPVVTPGGLLIFEFNGLAANGGSLVVGDTIQLPKTKVPKGCARIVFMKVSDVVNPDTCYLRGSIGSGANFITPCFGQPNGVPINNSTNASTSNATLQSPVCCTDVTASVTLATSVPASLQMVLAFCPA